MKETASLIQTAYGFIGASLPRLDRLYESLADEESKSLLVAIMAFRALGYRKVKLPFNTPEHARGIRQVEARCSMSDPIEIGGSLGWKLGRIDLADLGIPIRLHSIPWAAYVQFLAQQYRCASASKIIEASPGDIVIDGGGCWGDTALYFANKTGESGTVFTFEFTPANLKIMDLNFELNPALKRRITVVERALWNHSGESMVYGEEGPGTSLTRNGRAVGAQTALTASLDDFANQQRLARIDFIKLDVEGAELLALKGAQQTLERFKPKLAVCVYHRLEDFFDIPDYLDSLGLGYRFFLRHFTIHAEETILFACVD
jgi:FkbM family methyltransferase